MAEVDVVVVHGVTVAVLGGGGLVGRGLVGGRVVRGGPVGDGNGGQAQNDKDLQIIWALSFLDVLVSKLKISYLHVGWMMLC